MHKRIIALAIALVLLFGVVPAANAFADSTITVKETPTDDPDYIKIVKESDGKTITDGTAIFKVEFFPNDSRSGTPARTWYYKTIDGYTLLNDESYVTSGAFGTSDPLYKNDLGLPTIPLGSIRITEAQAPEGYLKSDFKLEGKVTQPSTGADAEFRWTTQADSTIRYERDAAHVNNIPIKGNLTIIKKDAYEDIYLSGAGFRVLDGGSNTVAEGYTDRSGEVTFENLPYGKDYTYREFKPPMGFKPDDTLYPFEITENGVTVVKEKLNVRRPGAIQVKKQDANGGALRGAAFLLEYSTDEGGTWFPVKYREESDEITRGGCTSPDLIDGQLTTGDDGIVTFTGLRADSKILYRLTETVAPEGMSLIGGSLYVGTLPVESDNIYAGDAEVFDSTAYVYTLYVTATDNSLFRLPETGGGNFSLLPFAMLLAAAPITLIFIKRKESANEEIA